MSSLNFSKKKEKKVKKYQKPLDKSRLIKYNSKALAGVAESADAHV